MVKSEKHFFFYSRRIRPKSSGSATLLVVSIYVLRTYLPTGLGGGEERGRLTFLRGKGGEVRWRGVIANGFYICTPVRPVFPTIGHNIIHI